MSKFKQGFYNPTNPKKYIDDVKNIIYRSSWEYKFMLWCDNNPGVLKWSSESIIVPYEFLGKKHRYFPDFYIEVKDKDNNIKKYLIEIKPQKDAVFKKPKTITEKNKKRVVEQALTVSKNQAKWEAAREFCRINNMEFMVLTENELFK